VRPYERGDGFFSPVSKGARVCLFLSMPLNTGPHRIPIIGITPMHVLKGMSKKRHSHAHSPSYYKELKWYLLKFFWDINGMEYHLTPHKSLPFFRVI